MTVATNHDVGRVDALTFRDFYYQTGHHFVQYFLEQACEWGTRTRGPDAPVYISIVQEVYLNVRSALLNAFFSLQTDSPNGDLWLLWQSAVIKLYDFYDYRGLWEEMYNLLSDGLREARKRSDAKAEAIFLFYQARIDSNQGRSQQASQKSERSLLLFRVIRDEGGIANLLHFRGMQLRKKDPQAAYRNLQEALGMWERLNDTGGRASTLYEIGRLEENKGNTAEAERLYREALAVFRELNLPREQATLLFQLGGLLGDVEYLDAALQIYKSLMDERGYAQALHQLGRVWQNKGDYAQARQLYRKALQIFERLGAPNSIRSVEGDLDTVDNEGHK